jgi:hypothetical protein
MNEVVGGEKKTMVTVVPEISTLRSQMAKQKVRRWTRKYFTEQVLGVARQTTYNWEELIVEVYFETDGEKFSDYLFDLGTGEAILIPGEPWNHHQVEATKKLVRLRSRHSGETDPPKRRGG